MADDERLTRRWIAGAVVAGVAIRIAFALLYWTGQPLTRDEQEYLSLARSLAGGRGFVFDELVLAGPIEPFGRAPGYPAFLAIAGGGAAPGPSVPRAVQIAQSAVAAVGIVMAALIARRLWGARAARFAAVATAFYPPLVWISAYAYSEALFWPLGLLLVWSLDRLRDRSGSLGVAIGAGVLIGLGVLVRPALLLVLPLAALWLVFRGGRWSTLAAILIGATFVIGPWTARNYSHYGRFVLVATEGGVTFWTGNNALASGEGDMAANPDIKLASQALRARHPGLGEEAMEPVYYRESLRWIRENPGDWLWLEARKLFYLVVPIGPSYRLHSARYVAASVVSYGALLAVALTGFVRGGRGWRRTPGLWLMFGSAVAVCLIFFPQERFRLPVIDPVLIIGASAVFVGRDRSEVRG